MAFLELDNLSKHFGKTEVLKRINIEIDEGDFLVLVGPSGCGKSTLLNTIAGLEPLNDGDIRINGQSITDLHPSRRDIAMVFQSYALYPNMNVADNIGFGLEMRGVPRAERELAISRVAEILKIEKLLKRKPNQLSGGQRQRVAMGRALVRDPGIFLFDEPLSNLDAKLRVDMRTEIKQLHQRLGTTIVYVTHDQIEAMTLATHIAVLHDGELQQFGRPEAIYNKPDNLFVAGFMGSPSMNLIPVQIQTQPSGPIAHLGAPDNRDLRLPQHAGLLDYIDREVILGIRPEALTDPDGADRSANLLVEIDSMIDVVEPAGSDTFAVTSLCSRQVTARLRANAAVKPGKLTTLVFNMDNAVFFDPASGRRIV